MSYSLEQQRAAEAAAHAYLRESSVVNAHGELAERAESISYSFSKRDVGFITFDVKRVRAKKKAKFSGDAASMDTGLAESQATDAEELECDKPGTYEIHDVTILVDRHLEYGGRAQYLPRYDADGSLDDPNFQRLGGDVLYMYDLRGVDESSGSSSVCVMTAVHAQSNASAAKMVRAFAGEASMNVRGGTGTGRGLLAALNDFIQAQSASRQATSRLYITTMHGVHRFPSNAPASLAGELFMQHREVLTMRDRRFWPDAAKHVLYMSDYPFAGAPPVGPAFPFGKDFDDDDALMKRSLVVLGNVLDAVSTFHGSQPLLASLFVLGCALGALRVIEFNMANIELPVDHFFGRGKGTGKTLTLLVTLSLAGCGYKSSILHGSSVTTAALKNKSYYLGGTMLGVDDPANSNRFRFPADIDDVVTFTVDKHPDSTEKKGDQVSNVHVAITSNFDGFGLEPDHRVHSRTFQFTVQGVMPAQREAQREARVLLCALVEPGTALGAFAILGASDFLVLSKDLSRIKTSWDRIDARGRKLADMFPDLSDRQLKHVAIKETAVLNLCNLYDTFGVQLPASLADKEAVMRGFERLLSLQPAADKHLKDARVGVTALLNCLAVGLGADTGLLAQLELRSAPDDVDDYDNLRDEEARLVTGLPDDAAAAGRNDDDELCGGSQASSRPGSQAQCSQPCERRPQLTQAVAIAARAAVHAAQPGRAPTRDALAPGLDSQRDGSRGRLLACCRALLNRARPRLDSHSPAVFPRPSRCLTPSRAQYSSDVPTSSLSRFVLPTLPPRVS